MFRGLESLGVNRYSWIQMLEQDLSPPCPPHSQTRVQSAHIPPIQQPSQREGSPLQFQLGSGTILRQSLPPGYSMISFAKLWSYAHPWIPQGEARGADNHDMDWKGERHFLKRNSEWCYQEKGEWMMSNDITINHHQNWYPLNKFICWVFTVLSWLD